MGRVANGAPARRGAWPPIRCSWDDWAVVIGAGEFTRNRDRVVVCQRLASDPEELMLRHLGLDWSGWLWLIDRKLVWVDEDGSDHWLPFAPDSQLRRINSGEPMELVEATPA